MQLVLYSEVWTIVLKIWNSETPFHNYFLFQANEEILFHLRLVVLLKSVSPMLILRPKDTFYVSYSSTVTF